MTSVEWPAIAAMATIGGFALSFATFWYTFGSRITKAEAAATAAQNEALAASKDAKEANEKIAIMAAAHALFREQVAKEYINREVAREMEDRLTAAIDRLGDRFDRFVEAVARK